MHPVPNRRAPAVDRTAVEQPLTTLVRRWATASHLVGERGVQPDGIDDATFEWWVAAHQALRSDPRSERQ